ncbi:hypothetical protein [Nocardioides sp.]|uniref:hypothetical protein n=1 Tax=Nocardioides sp. TaxID=35761 RepID=UPI0039E21CB2
MLPGRIEIDPFPFRAPVRIEVEVRLLPDRGWTRAEAVARLDRQPARTKQWQVCPAG